MAEPVRFKRRRGGSLIAALVFLALSVGVGVLSGCGGGGMSEVESDVYAAEAGGIAAAASDSVEVDEGPPQTGSSADQSLADEREAYQEQVAQSLLSTWAAPRRDANTPPPSASVRLRLDPRGQLLRWEFHRRSSNGTFNRALESYLDGELERAPLLPLPPSQSPLMAEVQAEGVVVEVRARR